MISICLPTRGRPESFKKMCLSALENASDSSNIEFVVYRDNDDHSVYEYLGNNKEKVGDRIIQSQMYNECYKIATGPIYMFAADDIAFYTKDWDKHVKEAFDKSADKVVFVYSNEHRHSNFGSIGFLHKNWVDTVAYFLPPYFAAGKSDRWINDIADRINRKIFLEQVVIKHLRVTGDKTNIEYLERGKKENCDQIYRSKEAERDTDAKKLQNFIDSHNT